MAHGPEGVVAIVGVFGVGALLVQSVKEMYLRRLEAKRGTGSLGAGMDARLERIEQAVDAIAIEMERVSEGQRFTTKLLAERPPSGAPSELR
jgi:hypothetical protein